MFATLLDRYPHAVCLVLGFLLGYGLTVLLDWAVETYGRP